MKIGIVKDKAGYGRWGEECYKKMKEHGFSCADFDMSDTYGWPYDAPEEEVVSEFSRERKLAEEAGIEIWQVHGPWRFPLMEETEEGRVKYLEILKKSIRYTAVLGCKNWVIHPVMPCGWEDPGREEETWRVNVDFFTELVKTAKECGVTICIENMPFGNLSVSRPESIMKLVNTINDDNFKICMDTGHIGIFEDLSIGDAVRCFGDKLQVLHVHDTIPGKDIHIMPYFGKINWEEFLTALKEIGFKGVFNLETPSSKNIDTPVFEIISKALAVLAKEMSKEL